jgi:hypothetical protein
MSAQQPTWPIDIYGIYFTIISILVVFQVLDLQLWVESVNQHVADFDRVGKLAGATNREARDDWRRRGTALRTRYPSWITYGVWILQVGLFVLGLIVDHCWIVDVPCFYTTVPLVGYMALAVGGPIAMLVRCRRSIDEIGRKLGKWDET